MSETKSVDGWSGVINGRPKVGDSAERTRRTRMEDILLFTEMTGDHNPLHYDQKLAEESVFGKLIVQGGEIRFPEKHGRESDDALKAELDAIYSHRCEAHP